ncbi:hypothetical protein B0H11DRAFT_1904431 [Mycena galericulata]|nr:hypothetical protein B0H11DRAFT_1904431 [Mycena galericulata]
MYRPPLLLIVSLALIVAAMPARAPAITLSSTTLTAASPKAVNSVVSSASTFSAQQQFGIAYATSVSNVTGSSALPVVAEATKALRRELSDGAEQPTIPSTTSFSGPDFRDMGDMLSPKIIFGIIFGFTLFVAVNVALCLLWYKCHAASRSRRARRLPGGTRVTATVSYPAQPSGSYHSRSHSPRQTTTTRPSGSNDGKEDVSVWETVAAGVELQEPTRPMRVQHSRPREPLMEADF